MTIDDEAGRLCLCGFFCQRTPDRHPTEEHKLTALIWRDSEFIEECKVAVLSQLN